MEAKASFEAVAKREENPNTAIRKVQPDHVKV